MRIMVEELMQLMNIQVIETYISIGVIPMHDEVSRNTSMTTKQKWII